MELQIAHQFIYFMHIATLNMQEILDNKLSYLRYIDSFNVVLWEEMAVLGALGLAILEALNGTNSQTKYWFSKNLGINVSNVTKSSICEKTVKSETKH